MPGSLPPAPINEPPGSFAWEQWYTALAGLYQAEGSIPWDAVSKTGSDVADLATRTHNNMQSIQGGTSGSHYHLIAAIKGSKTHDFGSIAAFAQSTTTQAVTGAGTNDCVIVTPQTNTAGIVYWGYVSAADTVTIVAQNTTNAAVDPASTVFNILVLDN